MSLAVASEGKDGVVLAADSRGTIGDPRGLTAINDTQEKLFKLTTRCGICLFGSAEIGVEIVRRIQVRIGGRSSESAPVDEIEEAVREVARTQYKDWFSSLDMQQRPALGLLLAGIKGDRKPRSIVFVSQLDFAPQPAVSGLMMGGIPQYAIYLSHRFYDRMQPVAKLASLAEYLISETATQDPKVGGPIKIALITTEKGYEELTPEQVEQIHSRNTAQSQALREYFYKVPDNAK